MKTKRFTIPTFFLIGVAIPVGLLYYELFSLSFCKGWICTEIDPRFVLDVPQLILVLGLHFLPVIPVSKGRVNVIVWGHEYSHAFMMSLFGVIDIRLEWNVPLVGDPQSATLFRRLLARLPGTHNVSSDSSLTREQYVFVALAPAMLLVPFGLVWSWGLISNFVLLTAIVFETLTMLADIFFTGCVLTLPYNSYVSLKDEGLSLLVMTKGDHNDGGSTFRN